MLLLSRPASADPLVITGGYFRFLSDGGAAVDISGPGFSVGNADSNPEEFGVPGLAIEHADASAATLPLGGHILPNFSGRLTFDDGPPDSYYTLQFDLHFRGGSAAPHLLENGCISWERCDVIAASGPFLLSGEMIAQGYSSETLSRWSLTGRGTATVGFQLTEGRPPRPFAIYTFAPVPEPTTLMLLGVGMGAIGIRRRRRT